jgi:hypothetical protein
VLPFAKKAGDMLLGAAVPSALHRASPTPGGSLVSRLAVNGFKLEHLVWARQGSRQAKPKIPKPHSSNRLGHYYILQG